MLELLGAAAPCIPDMSGFGAAPCILDISDFGKAPCIPDISDFGEAPCIPDMSDFGAAPCMPAILPPIFIPEELPDLPPVLDPDLPPPIIPPIMPEPIPLLLNLNFSIVPSGGLIKTRFIGSSMWKELIPHIMSIWLTIVKLRTVAIESDGNLMSSAKR
jgi:hypothetical protein